MIPVVEIFGPTIQGEGPQIGARCIFVRVRFCDFSCSFCDSKFTWAKEANNSTNYDEVELANLIVARCKETSCYRVVLTGGNPCLYDFSELISKCHSWSIRVDIETQGSIIPDWLDDIDTVVFSPKPPSSDMPDTFATITNYIEEIGAVGLLSQTVAIKIPVFNDEDIQFARNYAHWIENYNLSNDGNVKMYLSVGNSDVNTTEQIRDRVLADYENLLNAVNKMPKDFQHVYVLPQLHTLVWGNKQGV